MEHYCRFIGCIIKNSLCSWLSEQLIMIDQFCEFSLATPSIMSLRYRFIHTYACKMSWFPRSLGLAEPSKFHTIYSYSLSLSLSLSFFLSLSLSLSLSPSLHTQVLRACGQCYHPSCFRCVICGLCLDGVPYIVSNSLKVYCIHDYHK